MFAGDAGGGHLHLRQREKSDKQDKGEEIVRLKEEGDGTLVLACRKMQGEKYRNEWPRGDGEKLRD